jgi:hypothetical protein
MTQDRKTTQGSLSLRRHAERCLRLATTLPPGEAAEQMHRLAQVYVELADQLDAAAIASAAASQTGDAARPPEARSEEARLPEA